MNSMTLEEKVDLMSGKMSFDEVRGAIKGKNKLHYNEFPYPAGGSYEKGVPQMLFCDGSRGVVCGTGKSTCFPVSLLRGATFNKRLEEQIGAAMSKEVLAYGGNLFAGVCINLPYHPGWGRSQETYSEDSFVLGEMGAAMVRGIQKQGVIACIKHFAFNQMENGRFQVNITCSKRTEREVFLAHFQKCIKEGAAAVMSSYNKYCGVMCGHHDYLLNQVLKKEWDFDGFIMSDFMWGIKDTIEAVNGGQTMEMPTTKYFGSKLIKAVEEGKVPECIIDDAVLRIMRTLLATKNKKKFDSTVIGCLHHRRLARQCAEEGITLIKNHDNILPINRAKTKKIVVFGRLADEDNLGDQGSSQVFPPYVVSPLKGILQNSSKTTEVIFYAGANVSHGKRLAESADAVVFIAGYDHHDEGEFVAQNTKDLYTSAVGGDRKKSLGLHLQEQEFIKEVGRVNKTSIVVLIGGSMIMLDDWKDSVSSILMAYYPGMEGGNALARILFGDVNPSGKLPFVIPEREMDLPVLDWNAKEVYYDYYHGYQKLDHDKRKPLVPFGFGLSYTEFKLDNMEVRLKDERLYAFCDVHNIGKRTGAEVIQMYVGFPEAQVERPLKALKGFERVLLRPKEKKRVMISCPVDEFAWYNETTCQFENEHTVCRVMLGNSSAEERLLKQSILL
ncbi:MAG TPA: glycoside hydrolase family 3 C-terminal domain-containing protein [Candidatus Merdenecus merdavium]|nr:glycoside hydrolase family 3 C-terminal domain-containing protein [Candidatus Merdenecus merdavium]